MDRTTEVASRSNRGLRLGLVLACLLALLGLQVRAGRERLTLVEVEFRGVEHLGVEAIERATGLKKGIPADPANARLAVARIEALYRDQGFGMSRVRLLEGGLPGDRRVTIAVEEGPWFDAPGPGVAKIEPVPAPADMSLDQAEFSIPKLRSVDDWVASNWETGAKSKVFPAGGGTSDPSASISATTLAHPTTAEGYRARSDLFASKAQYFRAIADRYEAILLDPGNSLDHLALGLSYCHSFHFDRGLAEIERGLSLAADSPTRAYAHRCRGVVLMDRKDWADALGDFSRAIELEPDQAYDRVRRGACRLMLGDFDRAIEDFDRAIEIEPSAYGLSGLANCWFNKGDLARAASICDRAVSLEPNEPEYQSSRAFLQVCRGRVDLALAEFDKLLKANPEDAMTLNFRAWAHLAGRDLAKAAADFDRVLEIAPCRLSFFAGAWIGDTTNLDAKCSDRPLATFQHRSRYRPDLYAVLTVTEGDEAKTWQFPDPYFSVDFITRPLANRWTLNGQLVVYYSCSPGSKSAAFGRSIVSLLQSDRKEAARHFARAMLMLGEEKAPGSSRPTILEVLRWSIWDR